MTLKCTMRHWIRCDACLRDDERARQDQAVSGPEAIDSALAQGWMPRDRPIEPKGRLLFTNIEWLCDRCLGKDETPAPIEKGYKETLQFEGKEWAPKDIEQEITATLRKTRIGQAAFWRVRELVGYLTAWLNGHVAKEWESCDGCDTPASCDSKGCARLAGIQKEETHD